MAQAKTTERQSLILLRLLEPLANDPKPEPERLWVDEDRLRDLDRNLMIVGRLVNRRLALRRQDEASGRKAYRLTATGIFLAKKLRREVEL